MRGSCNLKPASVNSWHTLTSMQNISAANIWNIFENISKLPQKSRKIFLNCRETIWCFPPVRQTEGGDMRLVRSFSTGTRTLFIREKPQTLSYPKLLNRNFSTETSQQKLNSFFRKASRLFFVIESTNFLKPQTRPNYVLKVMLGIDRKFKTDLVFSLCKHRLRRHLSYLTVCSNHIFQTLRLKNPTSPSFGSQHNHLLWLQPRSQDYKSLFTPDSNARQMAIVV